jgi:hypothetical protein
MTLDKTPEDDPHNYFDGYWRCGRNGGCGQTAGWGTDHVGVGACKLHGGASPGGPSGPKNGNWKHGLYSDVVREEDRETFRRIEDMTTAAKLEATLNMQVLKVRRAIEGMESDERADFMAVFEEVVAGAAAPDGEIDGSQLRALAQMLGQNDRAIREWMDLLRKTAKDLHKITDGETVTVEHATDPEGLAELKDMAEDLF